MRRPFGVSEEVRRVEVVYEWRCFFASTIETEIQKLPNVLVGLFFISSRYFWEAPAVLGSPVM
jgi:hypothetical protein